MTSLWRCRIVSVLLTGAVVAGCGGGDDARQVLSGGDDPTTTAGGEPTDGGGEAPATTEGPSTTGDVVTTSGGTTSPGPGEGGPVGGDERRLQAFCRAGERFLVEEAALGVLPLDETDTARLLFDRLEVSIAAMLLNTPDESLVVDVRRVEEIRARIVPELETIDFDVDRLDELADGPAVSDSVVEFGDVTDEVAPVFERECGTDPRVVEAEAEALVDELLGATPDTTSTPASDPAESDPAGPGPSDPATTDPFATDPATDPGRSGAVVGVSDDTGAISVDVPVEWVDVDGAPDDDLSQLIVAPDIVDFFGSYDRSGLFVLLGDTPSGAGPDAAAEGFDDFTSTLADDGCVLQESAAFEGSYPGDQSVFRCSDAPVLVHVAAGTGDAQDVYWLLLSVTPDDDPGIWTTVASSFVVG